MSARSSSGFALPLVLVAVAVASLSILALAQSGQGRERRARQAVERFNAGLSAETVEARIAHLLVTERLDARSLVVARSAGRGTARSAGRAITMSAARPGAETSIVLDGRPYAVSMDEQAPVRVQVQDDAGLLNLNGLQSRALERLLSLVGHDQRQSLGLAAALADYTDEDDLRRAGGRDGEDFARAGVDRPRNRALEDVRQAMGAPGWNEALSGGGEVIVRQTAVLAPGAPFNPNTATHLALRSVLGIDASSADRIIAARERQSLSTPADLIALTGTAEIDSNIEARPASSMLVVTTVTRGSSLEIFVYVTRLSIKQGLADRPIEHTRLTMPMRALSKERARVDENDRLVSLPKSARLLAP